MISNWSQASRKVHFFWLPIPAYAFLPFALTMFHLRLWTVCLTLVVVAVLGYLSYRGRTVQWIARRAQLKLRLGGMHARPIWYRRRTQTALSLDVTPLPQLSLVRETQTSQHEGARGHASPNQQASR